MVAELPARPTTAWIRSLRGPRNRLDPEVPYGFFVEAERDPAGRLVDVATILLTNRECTYTCLMCDLWQNTLDASVPEGAIVRQVEHALARLPPASVLKLYNAGSFFDPKAIPPGDWEGLARLARRFEAVVVECHPALVDPGARHLNELLGGKLQVAMGLETIHPGVLPRLNKRMTLESFAAAVTFLRSCSVSVRSFILIRPPWLGDDEGVEWAIRSLRFAQDTGVECSVLIPTRGGNGAMEALAREGHHSPPGFDAVERTLERALATPRGRVFLDLWDLERTVPPPCCGGARIERLRRMNDGQAVLPRVACTAH